MLIGFLRKDIVKIFVSSLKPYIFGEDPLVDVMAETRHELSNYRDIIEISEQIKRPEVKKESKDRTPEVHISRKSESYTKAPTGAPFAKDSKASN